LRDFVFSIYTLEETKKRRKIIMKKIFSRMKERGKKVVNTLTYLTVLASTYSVTLASGNAIKDSVNSNSADLDIEGVVSQMEVIGWAVVGGISVIGLVIFVGLLQARIVEFAGKKEGRSRGEAMGNIFYVFLAGALFSAAGVIIGMSKAIGAGLFG
jgi:TRAP-type C4-dicarboxylate transport system permease small subunit